jgi:hypothetical protein
MIHLVVFLQIPQVILQVLVVEEEEVKKEVWGQILLDMDILEDLAEEVVVVLVVKETPVVHRGQHMPVLE